MQKILQWEYHKVFCCICCWKLLTNSRTFDCRFAGSGFSKADEAACWASLTSSRDCSVRSRRFRRFSFTFATHNGRSAELESPSVELELWPDCCRSDRSDRSDRCAIRGLCGDVEPSSIITTPESTDPFKALSTAEFWASIARRLAKMAKSSSSPSDLKKKPKQIINNFTI